MLGERFRLARQQVGLSQMELANLAGLNVANYGKLERGAGNPTFDTIIRLATVLGRDPADFLAGITEEHLPPSKHNYSPKANSQPAPRKTHTQQLEQTDTQLAE